MPDDKNKVALGVGLVAAAGLGYLLLKKPVPDIPVENGAVRIEIRDSEGRLLESRSPIDLTEGESYTVTVTVTNTSTKGGVPWEASLELRVGAVAGGIRLIPITDTTAFFNAGASQSFNYSMNVPLGTGGLSGVIDAVVSHGPSILSSGSVFFTVIIVEIIYGATVDIGQ